MNTAKRPLRIAMLGLRGIDESIVGGVERHVRELAVRMAARGHDVTVFCRAGYQPAEKSDEEGVRLKVRPAIRSKHLEAVSHTLACMPEVMLPRSCGGYDIVHIHAAGPALFACLPRLCGRRVVVTLHGLDFLRAKWGKLASLVLRLGAWSALRFSSELIVVSRTLQEYCRAQGRPNAHWLPNGVSAASATEQNNISVLERYGLAPGGYVLSLGRLVPEKGIHYLIQAFRQLDTPLRLAIAGEGLLDDSYASDLRKAAQGDDRIVFTGALYGKEKEAAFRNARLFVLPSELEGMPITLLEVLSCGCPSLASNIPECEEIRQQAAEQGVENLFDVFASKDVTHLRQCLSRMLESPDLAQAGLRAKDYVLARYNWDNIADATLAVYAQAIQGAGPGRGRA